MTPSVRSMYDWTNPDQASRARGSSWLSTYRCLFGKVLGAFASMHWRCGFIEVSVKRPRLTREVESKGLRKEVTRLRSGE